MDPFWPDCRLEEVLPWESCKEEHGNENSVRSINWISCVGVMFEQGDEKRCR